MATDFNTRVSVKKGSLDMIGDSLRAHFGELKEEGTKSYYKGNGTKILNTPNISSLPSIITYEQPQGEDGDDSSFFEPVIYNPITKTLFHDHEWAPEANWFASQPLISSIQVHGAAYLKIKMTYIDNSEYVVEPYTWIGGGLHAHASDVQGEYLPYSSKFVSPVDAVMAGWGEAHCASCGQPVIVYTTESGELTYTVRHPEYCKYAFEMGGVMSPDGMIDNTDCALIYTGYNGPLIERTFLGDTFTLLWHVGKETASEIGHYIELQAFDANDNLMTEYAYTVNQVINEWSPADFSYQIDKLNNYPNAEEVKF